VLPCLEKMKYEEAGALGVVVPIVGPSGTPRCATSPSFSSTQGSAPLPVGGGLCTSKVVKDHGLSCALTHHVPPYCLCVHLYVPVDTFNSMHTFMNARARRTNLCNCTCTSQQHAHAWCRPALALLLLLWVQLPLGCRLVSKPWG